MTALPSELTLVIGECYELSLPSLATSGYRWDATCDDEEVVALRWLVGWPEESADSRPHLVGQSAAERLEITGSSLGQATIRLRQARPWESGPPRVAEIITVSVREA